MKIVITESQSNAILEKKPYKFAKGGYLIPTDITDKEASIYLNNIEFKQISKLNDNIRELYNNKVDYLKYLELHNKGVLQHVINKMKS